MLSIDLSRITTRKEAEKYLSEKIDSERVRGFILKNLQRTDNNNFTLKLNALSLLNNLDNIIEGIDCRPYFDSQITGFPVIFLKGEKSDSLPTDDFRDIQKVFPAAGFITVANAGHWIHADRPDEVVRNIKRLLENN
jgi:pimeloyl-ACP methyl ester carboxylesterase